MTIDKDVILEYYNNRNWHIDNVLSLYSENKNSFQEKTLIET